MQPAGRRAALGQGPSRPWGGGCEGRGGTSHTKGLLERPEGREKCWVRRAGISHGRAYCCLGIMANSNTRNSTTPLKFLLASAHGARTQEVVGVICFHPRGELQRLHSLWERIHMGNKGDARRGGAFTADFLLLAFPAATGTLLRQGMCQWHRPTGRRLGPPLRRRPSP